MKRTEKQTLTIYALLLILLALFFFSGSLMWLQHGQYHTQHGMWWMGESDIQRMLGHYMNRTEQ